MRLLESLIAVFVWSWPIIAAGTLWGVGHRGASVLSLVYLAARIRGAIENRRELLRVLGLQQKEPEPTNVVEFKQRGCK